LRRNRQTAPNKRMPIGFGQLTMAAANPDDNDAWGRIIAVIAKSKPSVAAALSRSQLTSVSEKAFTVTVRDNDYTMKMVKKNLAMIDAACREHAGRGVQSTFPADDAQTGNMRKR
jgi:hypothetical protein